MKRSGLGFLVVALLLLTSGVFAQTSSSGVNSSAVFVMTNGVDRNEVIAFSRNADGTLEERHRFATGGRGSGGNNDPLESQGSLTLSQDHSLLFAANAGSGEVSTFLVHGTQLALIDKTASGGSEPNAIAQHGGFVYVLNTGGSSNVVAFRLNGGRLKRLADSTRFLSTNTSGASSLAISPDGAFLVVVERLTNNIDTFGINGDGSLSAIHVNQSAGPGAFSGSFAPNGALLVSETGAAGVPNGSAASSYAVNPDGTLTAITTSIPTLGAANCWNAITPDGRFFYNSNAGSANLAGFAIAQNGALTPIGATIVGSNPTGATNLDIAVSADSKFLYTLNSGNGTVGIFAIQNDGTLINLGAASGIDAQSGFNGIAAN